MKEIKNWIASPIPAEMGAYNNDHAYIIGEVLVQVTESDIIDIDGKQSQKETFFPFAKVFQVGEHFRGPKVKPGDIVRLKDADALTFVNPRYEAWINNEYSKSNIDDKKVGDTPPKYLCNIWTVFGKRTFSPNPFIAGQNRPIFMFESPHVICKVVDIDKLLEALKA